MAKIYYRYRPELVNQGEARMGGVIEFEGEPTLAELDELKLQLTEKFFALNFRRVEEKLSHSDDRVSH